MHTSSRQVVSDPLGAPLCPGDKAQLPWHSMQAPSWSGTGSSSGAEGLLELAHALLSAKSARPTHVCLPIEPPGMLQASAPAASHGTLHKPLFYQIVLEYLLLLLLLSLVVVFVVFLHTEL